MRVSVIIPVYNAAEYVRQAVESALAQPETAEVILVEDGSQDDGLAVCQELTRPHPEVALCRHPDGKNHQQPATLNLGIRQSTCEYIAFLDADDFYLPDRFSVARELFAEDPELEGVYEALGEYVQSESALERWDRAGRPYGALTTMTERVSPEGLFAALVAGRHGYFHLNCTVVKRSVFDKTGMFDEHLHPSQDTAMIWKMAAMAKLAPGRLEEPVAVRRIHDRNTISAPRSRRQRHKLWMAVLSTVWHWCRENVDWEKQEVMLERFLNYAEYHRLDKSLPNFTWPVQNRLWLLLAGFRYPLLAREASWWKRLLPDRVVSLCHRFAPKGEMRSGESAHAD